ncbi:MAG: type II secretion system minor pseudopilin GspJ [Pseudomonadota bacterium]
MTRDAGFTLVEVMVATLIMGILTAMGAALLRDALSARDVVEVVLEETQELTLARSILKTDLAQVTRREVRGAYGEPAEQVFAGGDVLAGNRLMAFVRNGRHTVGLDTEGSSLEYVEYAVSDGNLVRRSRSTIDPVQDTELIERVLLNGVGRVETAFLTETGWTSAWDARGVGAGTAIPLAVSLSFDHPRFGEIEAVMLTIEGY